MNDPLTKSQLISVLRQTIDNALDPIHREIYQLGQAISKLEVKIINLEYQMARVRSYIPEMQRLRGYHFEGSPSASSDRSETVHKGIVDRDTEFSTPTQERHRCQCSECDPSSGYYR